MFLTANILMWQSIKKTERNNYMNNINKPKKEVIPVFQTITLTPKETQTTNEIPKVSDENVIISKKCVDENHK